MVAVGEEPGQRTVLSRLWVCQQATCSQDDGGGRSVNVDESQGVGAQVENQAVRGGSNGS